MGGIAFAGTHAARHDRAEIEDVVAKVPPQPAEEARAVLSPPPGGRRCHSSRIGEGGTVAPWSLSLRVVPRLGKAKPQWAPSTPMRRGH